MIRSSTASEAISYDLLNIPEPAVATVLPDEGENPDDVDFGKLSQIAIVKKKIYKSSICVGITSGILQLQPSFLLAPLIQPGQIVVPAAKWRNCIRLWLHTVNVSWLYIQQPCFRYYQNHVKQHLCSMGNWMARRRKGILRAFQNESVPIMVACILKNWQLRGKER